VYVCAVISNASDVAVRLFSSSSGLVKKEQGNSRMKDRTVCSHCQRQRSGVQIARMRVG